MVGGADGGGEVGEARCHDALEVAEPGGAVRLVEGCPLGDSVAECFGDDAGIFGEVMGGVAGGPAAAVLEGLWKVPVVQGDVGGDAGFEEGVDQLVVEGEAGGVHAAVAAG